MGQEFKRELDDEGDEELVDKADNLMDSLNKFADTTAKAVADARTAIEKKEKIEGADSAKKKSKASSDSNRGETDMDDEEIMEKIDAGFDKLIALKGPDFTLSEAQDFIDDNEELVKGFL